MSIQKQIKAVLVEPNKEPVEIEIQPERRALSKAIGESIQKVFPFEDSVCLICNEEGKLLGLPANRTLYQPDGKTVLDVIAGPFILCNTDEDGELLSMTDQQVISYINRFKNIEFNGSEGTTPYDEFFKPVVLQAENSEDLVLSILGLGKDTIIPSFACKRNMCIFMIQDGIPYIVVAINKPNELLREAADIRKYGIQLGLYKQHNVLTVAVCPGKLVWNCAFYHPGLDADQNIENAASMIAEKGEWNAIYLFVDSQDGRIVQSKILTFDAEFAQSLRETIAALLQRPFHYFEFQNAMKTIERRYSPKEIGTVKRQAYLSLFGEAE